MPSATGFRHQSLHYSAGHGQIGATPVDDYYFAVYFTLDTNNEHIAGLGQGVAPGALSGWFLYGDQTRIGVKGAIPTNENSDRRPISWLTLPISNQAKVTSPERDLQVALGFCFSRVQASSNRITPAVRIADHRRGLAEDGRLR